MRRWLEVEDLNFESRGPNIEVFVTARVSVECVLIARADGFEIS